MEKTPNPTGASNEQIVDELTKNLASNVSINKETTTADSTASTNQPLENPLEDSNIPPDFENSDTDESPPTNDDFIDEEKLKDLEIEFTEEVKLERHKESLALKIQGNEEFKREQYLDSANSYTEGLKLCPFQFSSDRSILYANRAASKAKLNRKESAIEDCTKAIELNDKYLKAYLRRAKLFEETDKLDESLADYNKVLEYDPGNQEALAAKVRLPPLINERNEKLKTEMLGKLKDLGNVILRPFGLSTDNFQFNQDPNTGGYSVNFQQSSK